MEERPETGDGSAERPLVCPNCDRTVGYANVVSRDFDFENATPLTTGPDGTPEFQDTGLEDGPQKAVELRCDFCGEEFALGVELGE